MCVGSTPRFVQWYTRVRFSEIVYILKRNHVSAQAMFGDIDTHGRTILPQCETYIHRFGPGMIIYWFGHAPIDRLHSSDGDISVVGWRLPDFSMTPTGEEQDVKPR